MGRKNPGVDRFVKDTKIWRREIVKLRSILLSTGLEENIKWRLPSYEHGGAIVAVVQPFKACLSLMFYKGMILKDPKKLLCENGPNSRTAKRMEFHSLADVTKNAAAIKSFVKQAIALEESGRKVDVKRTQLKLPAELTAAFKKKPKLKQAFQALTPGRQRGYILLFSGAKQSATRTARIEKYSARILAGKGIHDP